MPAKSNPFKPQARNGQQQDKEALRDPLDVRDLLTDASRKAVITPEGELKLQGKGPGDRPGIELMKERYWGNEFASLWNRQISQENRLMQSRFPAFELRKASEPYRRHGWLVADTGQFYWLGPLCTHGGSRYLVAVVYPPDYPFGEIYSYILEPFLPATEHRFQDGHLCLYDHEGNGRGFESGKTTAVTVIAWTSAWLHAYEIWRATGKWPTLEDAR